MAAAIELIATRGWGAVTTRMVAEQAGVRPGSVHYHFASVSDLLIDASLRLARSEVENALFGALETSGHDAISTMITAIAGYTGDDTATVVMSEMLLAATRHQRLRAELRQLLADARAAMITWLREQRAVNDPEATATVVLAALDGLILHRLIDPALGQVDVAGPLLRMANQSDLDEGAR